MSSSIESLFVQSTLTIADKKYLHFEVPPIQYR
jgi:hypothetical protein